MPIACSVVTASEPEAPDTRPAAEPTPLDRILDLAVYVPLGLALAARDVVPRLAEAGRRQLGPQLDAARVVGRLAVDQGGRQATQAIRRLAEQGGAALGGSRRPRATGGPGDAASAEAAAPPPDHDPAPVLDPAAANVGAPAPDAGPGADLDPAELAIPGYDTLSASQVVQRLPGLSSEELDAVRSYELAGRARKTIVLKVAQLRAP